MMKTKVLIGLIVLSIIFLKSEVVMGSGKIVTKKYTIENIELDIPSNVSVEKKSPVEDFVLCEFKLNKKYFLKAYIGNQPSAKNKNLKDNVINGRNVKMFEENKNGLYSREALFEFKDTNWPRYIQFTYNSMPMELKKVADKIIESTKMGQEK